MQTEGRWARAGEGSSVVMELARKLLADVASAKPDARIGYETTAYELPVIFSLAGKSASTSADAGRFMDWIEGAGLDAGEATLYAAEIAAAARHALGKGDSFIPDTAIREMGLYLVDGTIPGIAVIHGESGDAAGIARDLQQRGLLVLACGRFADQLAKAGMKESKRLLLLGDELSIIHAVDFAVRAGLAFGNIQRGERERMLEYVGRLKAFVLAPGTLNEVEQAANAGAEFLGLRVFTEGTVQEALDGAGIKASSVDAGIPVMFSPAFEGERIRKPDVRIEAGGGKSKSFELVLTRDASDVEDGKVTVIGEDIDGFDEGETIPLGILVEVGGKKMQKDFEPVLENKIELYCNRAEGMWFTGKRSLIWLRVSNDSFKKGLRLADIGKIIHAMFHNDFPALVDKVQVTIMTDAAAVDEWLGRAHATYEERDLRLKSMTDESVDAFYSCLLCQSFAPNHVCVITPERVGLCGSVSWLDAKAGHELTPSGTNQPIPKSGDSAKGNWKSVDEYVRKASHGHLESFNIYSAMENPCTACGCFECVLGLLPEANGFVVINREFTGETPLGMRFSTLAGSVSGGQQVPGFMGIAKRFMLSRKFLRAEGGFSRVVWMTTDLKRFLREKGMDVHAWIADETTAMTPGEVVDYMKKSGHPALGMDPLI